MSLFSRIKRNRSLEWSPCSHEIVTSVRGAWPLPRLLPVDGSGPPSCTDWSLIVPIFGITAYGPLVISTFGFDGAFGVGARASSAPTARLPIWRWSASTCWAGAVAA